MTKENYENAIMRMYNFCISSDHSAQIREQFSKDLDFLAKLAEEHFEEKQETKQETNFEHYKDEIIEDYAQILAVVKGRPTLCYKTNCNDCDFKINQIGCRAKAKDWLKQPHKKPTCKLTQFEYDLLNAHKDSGMQKCISNYRPLLELYEKGYFKDIDTSVPIHKILDNCEVIE